MNYPCAPASSPVSQKVIPWPYRGTTVWPWDYFLGNGGTGRGVRIIHGLRRQDGTARCAPAQTAGFILSCASRNCPPLLRPAPLPMSLPDTSSSRSASRKADIELLIKGVTCAVIGLVILLAPQFMAPGGIVQMMARSEERR